MSDNEKFIEGIKKEKIEQRINNYNDIINSDTTDKESAEYIKAQDVIEEIVNLLKKSKPEYSFVESIEVEKQIKYYQKMLKYLDKEFLTSRRAELEKILEDENKKILEMQGESVKTDSSTVEQEYIDRAIEEEEKKLQDLIDNREAMIAARGDELAPAAYEQLTTWKEELSKLKSGEIKPQIFDKAKSLEIKDLTERIANREAMIAGRDMPPSAYEQLNKWKEKLELLNNSLTQKDETNEIDKLNKSIQEHEAELNQIKDLEKELEDRDVNDIAIQKRVIENRIAELEDINKEKELFKINEKGEVQVNYPDVEYEIDREAIKKEYEARRQDMLDKFYGNRARGKEYSAKYQELQEHIQEKEFKYFDKYGNLQKGTYLTVERYEGMEEALAFLQLEEIVERLERFTKADAGDISVYQDIHVRNEQGKFVKVSPDDARKADEQYIESNNNAYNQLISTRDNLKTLGKYGEKVDYTKFKEGQPVRNIVRAVGNAAKFVRNHVTAPINKFVGSKIVSPIYGKIVAADDNVAGLYSNKLTHRYVARREYFESQGKGYFSSRFNSIFKAKEGNKAILSAGAYDIQKSLIKKYTEIAQQESINKKTEFASKSVEEKIAMIKADMDKSTEEANKAKLQATLDDLEKARVQIARDRQLNEKTATAQTIQTDAVDISQHDIANKENVTRTITGIKILSRLGIRKLIGPKIEEWLTSHATTTKHVVVSPTQKDIEKALEIQDQKWVPTTYKEQEVPVFETRLKDNASLSEMMSSNAGNKIEGYYSVYSGEARPAIYDLTGDEKITGIFQKTGEVGGTGLSDIAGLKAPTLTDGTFASELLDANGVLKQDVSIDEILTAVGNGTINPEELSSVYVSVGDRYWAKLSDLCSNVTEEVQIGTTVEKIPDVLGHYETLTDAEKMTAVAEALKKAELHDPNFLRKISRINSQVVENKRVTNVLKGLGIGFNVADNTLFVDDVYENVRKTDTKVDWEKPENRYYDHKTKFTGSRKQDMKKALDDGRDER